MQISKGNSEPKVPTDLRKALSSTPSVEALWDDLTSIARRDFITWIDGAKQAETRARRIKKTRSVLVAGKRRPCCYAVVPMNLYKDLGSNTKAQMTWKSLTAMERRDFVDWIDSAKDKETHKLRIEKACVMLVNGKRRP